MRRRPGIPFFFFSSISGRLRRRGMECDPRHAEKHAIRPHSMSLLASNPDSDEKLQLTRNLGVGRASHPSSIFAKSRACMESRGARFRCFGALSGYWAWGEKSRPVGRPIECEGFSYFAALRASVATAMKSLTVTETPETASVLPSAFRAILAGSCCLTRAASRRGACTFHSPSLAFIL